MVKDLKENLQSDEIIWSSVKLLLKDIYGQAEYSNWLKLLIFGKVKKETIIFYAPTKFMCDWILSHYGKKILSLWREKNKLVKDISITVYSGDNLEKQQSKDYKSFKNEILSSNKDDVENNLDPRFTFKDFVVGKSNELAFSACRRVADAEDVPFNPLFLYGGVGLGKTHLMHAIAWQKKKLNPKLKILYLSAEKFMYEFIKALRQKNTVAFKEQFSND